MDRSIAYSAIEDVSVWSKAKVIDSDCRFCIRIVTNDCIYFFQVKTNLLSNRNDYLFFRLIHLIYEINGSIQFNGRSVNIRSIVLSFYLICCREIN
jgi:hypothetical protein